MLTRVWLSWKEAPRRRRMLTCGAAGLAAVLLTCGARGDEAGTATGLRLLPASFWARGVVGGAAGPLATVVGDLNGDGLADLIGAGRGAASFRLYRTSALGKSRFPVEVNLRGGGVLCAAVCGRFDGPEANERLLTLATDGAVRVFSSVTDRLPAPLLTLPPERRPSLPLRGAVSADLNGDGLTDALLVGGAGEALALLQSPAAPQKGTPRLRAVPLPALPKNLRRFASGRFTEGTDRRARLVWMEADGTVRRSVLTFAPGKPPALAPPVTVLKAPPTDALLVGRFAGGPTADILIGQRLLPGGDPTRAVTMPDLPRQGPVGPDEDAQALAALPPVRAQAGLQEAPPDDEDEEDEPDGPEAAAPEPAARADHAWLCGDVDGDGRDDVLRVTGSGAAVVHFAHSAARPNRGFQSSTNDGLPDAWKTGRIQPGGLDLSAMGCAPGRRDVIVFLHRVEDVPEAHVRAEMEKVRQYFAALPVKNPDGTTGIRLHVLLPPPIPLGDAGLSFTEEGRKYHPRAQKGVTHYMAVKRGIAGVSRILGDVGHCGSAGLYAKFLHEFGHQLGLGHQGSGDRATFCPLYPSLMNYSYSYGIGGGRSIGYSTGELAGFPLNEAHLNERLPFPIERVAFLEHNKRSRFRLQATPDNRETLVDWNRNGVFGEPDVAADINHGHGINDAPRVRLGGAQACAPAVAALGAGEAATVLMVRGQPPGRPSQAQVTSGALDLSPARPGSLRVRAFVGGDPSKNGGAWSPEMPLCEKAVGEASLATAPGGGFVVAAAPTSEGVALRRIGRAANGGLTLGAPVPVAGTDGAVPTVAAFGPGRFALLLWRGPDKPLALRLLNDENGTLAAGKADIPLGFTSLAPVGAANGPADAEGPSLWVGTTEPRDKKRPAAWRVRRLQWAAATNALRLAETTWVEGGASEDHLRTRLTLLWEPEKSAGERGRLFVLGSAAPGSGTSKKNRLHAEHRVSMTIGDRSHDDGWLNRTYGRSLVSRHAPAACFFRGELVVAGCYAAGKKSLADETLGLTFRGRGLDSRPMGDHDDVERIVTVGLSQSIPYVAE